MLEIKHVTKVYKTKGGVDTKALDDVSISFGETGLVFLLGKSGSGKSTLLNVCGGLDEPTSAEVIVKGKRSKDFSGSDFDSYRSAQARVSALYRDPAAFARVSLYNIAGAGIFSADRAIREYADEIWHLD